MSLLIALRAESGKMKRTATYYLPLLLAAVVPFLTFFFDKQSAESRAELNADPWRLFYTDSGAPFNFLFLPVFVLLVCTLPPQMEYRNNTWKQVLATPLSRTKIYLSKWLTVLMLTVVFLVAYHLLMAVALVLFAYLHPDVDIWKKGPDVLLLATDAGISFVVVLPIAAAQFLMGLRFRNFLVPFGVGFVLWLASNMLTMQYNVAGEWLPYSYTALVAFPDETESHLPTLLTAAPIIAGALLLAGAFWFRRSFRS